MKTETSTYGVNGKSLHNYGLWMELQNYIHKGNFILGVRQSKIEHYRRVLDLTIQDIPQVHFPLWSSPQMNSMK